MKTCTGKVALSQNEYPWCEDPTILKLAKHVRFHAGPLGMYLAVVARHHVEPAITRLNAHDQPFAMPLWKGPFLVKDVPEDFYLQGWDIDETESGEFLLSTQVAGQEKMSFPVPLHGAYIREGRSGEFLRSHIGKDWRIGPETARFPVGDDVFMVVPNEHGVDAYDYAGRKHA